MRKPGLTFLAACFALLTFSTPAFPAHKDDPAFIALKEQLDALKKLLKKADTKEEKQDIKDQLAVVKDQIELYKASAHQ